MARQYKTGLIITGDASGGIKAVRATEKELGQLNQRFDGGSRGAKRFSQASSGVSRELQVVKRMAAPVGAALAGMFAANTLREQINFADQLQKTNLRIGASTEALSEYAHVANLADVQFNQLTTAWQRQSRRIAQAARNTGEAKDALAALNLDAGELARLAPEDQFERIAEAMSGVAGEAQRVAYAQKIWDSEGVKLLQIVNQGTDAIRAQREEAERLGLTISQGTAEAMAGFNDEVTRLQAVGTGLSRQILSELVPAMTSGMQATSEWVEEVGGAAQILDTTKDVAAGLAGLLAGRYLGAITTSTAAKLAATRQAVLYQAALARMAGASATAAGAQTALAASARAASGALALVGGPAGAAIIAAGAIYTFREELGLVPTQAETARDRVNSLTGALNENSEAALKNARSMLEAERQINQFRQAALALEVVQQRQVVHDEYAQWEAVGGQQAFGMGESSEAQQELHELEVSLMDARKAAVLAGEGVSEIDAKLAELRDTLDGGSGGGGTTSSVTEQADASDKAAKATGDHADELDALRKRLDPAYAASQRLAQSTALLERGLATGAITLSEYLDLWDKAAGVFIDAGETSTDTTDVVNDNSDEMAALFERSMERMDDAAVDMWRSFLDGSEDAFDSFKNIALDTLAEVIHQYTTRQITASIGGNFSIGGGGGVAGAMGGGGGISSMLGTGGGLQTLGNAWNAFQGTGSTYAGTFGSELAVQTQGGLKAGFDSFANSGLGAAAANIGGAIGGDFISGSLFGESQSQQIGSQIGAIAGNFIPVPVVGPLIGSTIGGALGSVFGHSPTPFSGRFGTRSQGAGGFEHLGNEEREGQFYRDSALGRVGFFDSGTERLQRAGTGSKDWADELSASAAQMDNLVASLADGKAGVQAMRDAVQGLETSSSRAGDIVEFALEERPQAALDTIGGAFGEFIDTLDGGVQEVIAQAQAGRQALDYMSEASGSLGLDLDSTASGSYEAAAHLANMAGGLQSFTQRANYYYQNIVSEEERHQDAMDAAAEAMGQFTARTGEAVSSTDELKNLVDGLDLSTQAGRELYDAAMNLAPSLVQVEDGLDRINAKFDEMAREAESALNDAEQQARQAWQAFQGTATDQQLTLLELIGDEEEALALKRKQELEGIDPLLRETQERIWALQDEAKAQQEAAKAAQDYRRELATIESQLSTALGSISQWIDTQQATGQSPGNNLTTAGDQFARQLALAESGDRAALQSITQYADQYLAAGRDMYASGSGFQRIEQDVLDALESLPDAISAEEFLAEEIKQALQEATSDISTELGGILRGDNPSRIAGALSGHFATLAGGIDGVLTREQLAVVMAGKATDAQLDALMRAVDLNGDGVMTGLESVIIKSMPHDATLANVLRNQLERSRNQALSVDEVRTALNPIASKAVINRLINRADLNADGIITAQELANTRLDGLASGIGSALHPMFDSLDSSLDGLIDYTEFASAFEGMATDAQLLELFNMLDRNGDGTISAIEAGNFSNEEIDENTKSLEERSLEQLGELNRLVEEMARTTDQFSGLNSTMTSLQSAITALGVAQEEAARIERERHAAEIKAMAGTEKDRLSAARNSAIDRRNTLSSQVRSLSSTQDRTSDYGSRDVEQAFFDKAVRIPSWEKAMWDSSYDYYYQGNQKVWRGDWAEIFDAARAYRSRESKLDRLEDQLADAQSSIPSLNSQKLKDLRADYRDLMGKKAPFAAGGVFTNSVVDQPTSFAMGLMGEAGPEAIMPLTRHGDGSLGVRAELPPLPPLLGQEDVVEVLRDLKREVAELRRENAKLQGEGNKHAAASVQVQQAGFRRAIGAAERGNEHLDDMARAARLEAAR